MRTLSVRVVGVSFDRRQAAVMRLRPGDPVMLVKEPDNAHDKNAIMVMSVPPEESTLGDAMERRDAPPGLQTLGLQLGYIPRDLAGVLSKCFASRMLAVVQSVGTSASSGLHGLSILVELHE